VKYAENIVTCVFMISNYSRYLFWAEVSNWAFDMPSSDIFRSDLSGENRKGLGSYRFMMVSGLTLDVVRRRIYVADKHKHRIESLNYAGEDRLTVLDSEVRFENMK
jgi:hypothetical protein